MNASIGIVIICLAYILIVTYAFFIEPFLIQVRKIDIHISKLPPQMDGFTFCHLSDTHSTGYGILEKLIRRKLSDINADICVITGDLVQKLVASECFGRIFEGFKPAYGIYAIPGNGEHKWKVDIEALTRKLLDAEIKLMVNSNVLLDVNDCRICIISVDDPFMAYNDIKLAYNGCSDSDFELLLAHSPDILADIGDRKPRLILSGHTHGGQVRLPFIGALWLHCRYPYGISEGFYGSKELSTRTGKQLDGICMYVSRGLGASIIHARFLCRPEIAILTLRSGD
ncbi:MAG: metallophosphoesterase [Armatimonadota bacterium]